MNKNLLSFVFLSIAVYLGWIWYMNKTYPHLADDKAKAAATVALATPNSQSGVSGVSPTTAVNAPIYSISSQKHASTGAADLVTVTSDAMEVVLSSSGAKAISWKLLAYRAQVDDPEPVQLVAPQIESQDGAFQLSNASLETDAWKLESKEPRWNPDGTLNVVFGISIPGTPISFRKTFAFDKKDFIVHEKIEIINSGKHDFSIGKSYLLWGPGIGLAEQGRAAAIAAGGAVQMEGQMIRVRPNFSTDPAQSYADPKWVALKNHYFLAAYLNDAGFSEAQLRLAAPESMTKSVTAALGLGEFVLKAGETKSFDTRLYVGPQDIQILDSFHNNLEHVIQFSFQWLNPISVFLLWLLRVLHAVSNNWGVAVILLTVLIKLVLFYPTQKGMVSSRRMQTRMAKMKPVLDSLKKTYKDDPSKLQQETMRLYKENGVNPLGGCFLMLPQMIVLYALYGAVNGGFELRGVGFFGPWRDLSAPDPTHVLVPLMGLSMWLQQKMAPTAAGTASDDQVQMQKMMMYMMPIMFTVMGFTFGWPTGLLLYWSVSNVFGIFQQWYVNKTVS
jgi:YidC/Oxa1 family membrane protein insertase